MSEKIQETVLLILGAIVLLCAAAALILLLDDKTVDSFIVGLGLSSLTGLLGVLAPNARDNTPQPVSVVNRPDVTRMVFAGVEEGVSLPTEMVNTAPVQVMNEEPVEVVEAERPVRKPRPRKAVAPRAETVYEEPTGPVRKTRRSPQIGEFRDG